MPKYILSVDISNFDDHKAIHQELSKYDFYWVIKANEGIYY
ncbi:MAG: hypothetical protein ABWY16_03430 [Pedobacter sp.]